MKTLLVLWIFLSATAFAAEQDVEVLIDENYLHYSFKDERGNPAGAYTEILRRAFARMENFNVRLVPVPWERGKMLMRQGEGFALAPAFFHGHDWPYLYPYSLPFNTETIIAACDTKKLTSPRPSWPNDYVGLKIGNISGFTGWGGSEFFRLVADKKIAYEESRGSVQTILKLLKGRVDCIMMERTAFEFIVKHLTSTGWYNPKEDTHYQISALVDVAPVYVGYSKPALEANKYPFHLEFRQAFDAEIYRMTRSGEIARIVQTYLDTSNVAEDIDQLYSPKSKTGGATE